MARSPPSESGATMTVDAKQSPFYAWLDHATIRDLVRRALELSAGKTSDGELRYRFATGYDDPVIRHLGAALLPALESGGPSSGLFLDHILYAVAAHVLGRYGEAGPPGRRPVRAGPRPAARAIRAPRCRQDA